MDIIYIRCCKNIVTLTIILSSMGHIFFALASQSWDFVVLTKVYLREFSSKDTQSMVEKITS